MYGTGKDLEKIAKSFENTPLRILEVGCGEGLLFSRWLKEGHEVWGIEPERDAANRLIERYPECRIIPEPLEDASLPENYFDLVYMLHVIEHLTNPLEDMKKIYRALKEHGVLFLITPDADSKGFNVFKESWWYLEDPSHRFFFTPRSVRFLLERVGFSDVEILKPLFESFTFEASSMFRKLNLKVRNFIIKSILLLLFSGFLFPLRLFFPSFRPSIQ
ncbi:hypothetical protein DRQ18_07545, partial [bacterium]